MKKILIATTNQGKIAEVKHALEHSQWHVVTPVDINLGDINVAETGTTFAENALIKAKAYAKKSGLVTLADDSGLVVDALDGRPGVYSARYGTDDLDRNQKLLQEMTDKKNRIARFEAAIAIHDPNTNITQTFTGSTEGEILHTATGTQGFGYDPIFFSKDLHKSFGEASMEEKNTVSHRGRALIKAIEALKKWSWKKSCSLQLPLS